MTIKHIREEICSPSTEKDTDSQVKLFRFGLINNHKSLQCM